MTVRLHKHLASAFLYSKFFILIVSFLLSLTISQAQTKTIRGRIFDALTRAPVKGVSVYGEVAGDTAHSLRDGYFEVILPKSYKGIVTYSKPGFYSYSEKLIAGSRMQYHLIEIIPDTLQVDTFCFPTLKENRNLYGKVMDISTLVPVFGARIAFPDGKVLAYSNRTGEFETGIPIGLQEVFISAQGYHKTSFILKPGKNSLNLDKILLKPVKKDTLNDFWKKHQNSISWMANEIIFGSVGLCYERFLAKRHAVGLKSSFYLFGWGELGLLDTGSPKFKGIEVAPFYRFYFSRNYYKGVFIEPRLIYGHYNFERFSYADENHVMYKQLNVNAYGGAALIGFTFLHRDPRLDFPYITFCIGYQILPLDVPKTYDDYHYETYKAETNFWYLGGPGSIIEIKIMIGGVF